MPAASSSIFSWARSDRFGTHLVHRPRYDLARRPSACQEAVRRANDRGRIVGPARARDIMFSARFMEAQEAHHMGLINFIENRDEIESATIAYAKQIAANAPLTVKAAKAAIDAWERGSSDDALAAVHTLVNDCFDSEDYKEGRRAFKEKRTPDFKGC